MYIICIRLGIVSRFLKHAKYMADLKVSVITLIDIRVQHTTIQLYMMLLQTKTTVDLRV